MSETEVGERQRKYIRSILVSYLTLHANSAGAWAVGKGNSLNGPEGEKSCSFAPYLVSLGQIVYCIIQSVETFHPGWPFGWLLYERWIRICSAGYLLRRHSGSRDRLGPTKWVLEYATRCVFGWPGTSDASSSISYLQPRTSDVSSSISSLPSGTSDASSSISYLQLTGFIGS